MIDQIPHEAEIVERIQESESIYTLRLRFTDPAVHVAYRFAPGQFNMLYHPLAGEVPISIVSDPEDEHLYDHAIRTVGRVTRAIEQLKSGDRIGVRGPYGRGWPMDLAEGRNLLVATGGLGCAPVVSAINYVLKRRDRFGRLTIMQGVKHADDLIWRDRYERWAKLPNTEVLLAASQPGRGWPWHSGHVTALLDQATLDPDHGLAMMCGPPGMMQAMADLLAQRGYGDEQLWLSMERNMQCGIGLCGHCQMGGLFVCKDGPVFHYGELRELMGVPGF